MNSDTLLKKTIRFSQQTIFKYLFILLEVPFYYYFYHRQKRGHEIDGKLFRFIQIFSNGRLYTLYRRKKHRVLSDNLRKENKIDNYVHELTNKSFVKLFDINKDDVKKTYDFFTNQKIYNSHVPFNDVFPNKLISVDEFLNTQDYHYGAYDIETSLNSQIVKKLCKSEIIWNVARRYLASDKAKIYSINSMLTKQSKKMNYVVKMHKDFDCASSVTFFVYWTDVSKNNGATRILPGNHLFEHDKKVQTHISESIVQYLEGNSGSVFAVDTWALHAGNPIITSPRLVTWIRFSSMPAKSYFLDNNYLFKNHLNELNQEFIKS